MKSDLWVTEPTGDYLRTSFRVSRTLFSGKSPFQSVDVVESPFFGRMLLNDGVVMVSERDEFVYHEMIAHVPLFAHPGPKDVLIIGGGDGGAAREVLRHGGVASCVMVEIDGMVVDACREHLPRTGGVLGGDDPRLELVVGDGVAYARETDRSFDAVLVDSTDCVGPAVPLFGPGFHDDVARILRPGGVVVAQNGSPWHNADLQRDVLGVLARRFPVSLAYCFSNLTYADGFWSFAWASKGPRPVHPVRDLDPARVRGSGIGFRYYGEDVHRAAFALPGFMRENLRGVLKEGEPRAAGVPKEGEPRAAGVPKEGEPRAAGVPEEGGACATGS